MKYPQCTGKAAGRKRKQFKVLKLSNLFFFFFCKNYTTSILFIVRNLVWIVEVLFYSKILASLTCNLIYLQMQGMKHNFGSISCTLYSYPIHTMKFFKTDYKFWRNYSKLSDTLDYREHSQCPELNEDLFQISILMLCSKTTSYRLPHPHAINPTKLYWPTYCCVPKI